MKNFLEKSWENGPAGRKEKKDRAKGGGRNTREELVQWNQMTALRFQTGGGGGLDILGFPSGTKRELRSTWHWNTLADDHR